MPRRSEESRTLIFQSVIRMISVHPYCFECSRTPLSPTIRLAVSRALGGMNLDLKRCLAPAPREGGFAR